VGKPRARSLKPLKVCSGLTYKHHTGLEKLYPIAKISKIQTKKVYKFGTRAKINFGKLMKAATKFLKHSAGQKN
jgi:hypothetical protein